jgi:hypothetical protein
MRARQVRHHGTECDTFNNAGLTTVALFPWRVALVVGFADQPPLLPDEGPPG